MDRTKIDWCDSTWNPVTGCLHGCEYCYARGIANRFSGGGEKWTDDNLFVLDEKFYAEESEKAEPYPYGFMPTFHRYKLDEYANKKGRNIFVCYMADLFGTWVPEEWIMTVFESCKKAPQHNYLFLTKNPDRYISLLLDENLPELPNMWYGATVTNSVQAETAEATMQDLPSESHAFLSIEPLMEDVSYALSITIANFTDWVIVGAETGRNKNKVVPKREWIESLVSECRKYNIPIFMKSSLSEIWGEQLIQDFPEQLMRNK